MVVGGGGGGSEILFGALRTKGGVSFKAEMSEKSGLLPDMNGGPI